MEPSQGHPPSNDRFSPTNPFSGMNEGQAAAAAAAGPQPQHQQAGAGEDMAAAAARLANLQLASSGGGGGSGNGQQSFAQAYGAGAHSQGLSQAYSQAGGGMTGMDHLTAVPAPVAAAAAASPPPQQQFQQQQPSGSFAPGYGPQNPNTYAFNAVVQAPPMTQQAQGMPPPPLQQQQQQNPQQPQQQFPQQQQLPQQPTLPPMVGPMLQFVNVELERALWHGSVLVLTNETLLPQGSRAAAPPPPASAAAPAGSTAIAAGSGAAMHAGPTPTAAATASPNMHIPVIEVWDDGVHGPGSGKPKTFQAKAIYTEPTYKYTFWRADLTLPLPQENEVDVAYQIYWGADESAVQSHSARPTFSFRLPAQASQWRMCVTSNNQFSRRVPEAARAALRGSGPVLRDLLAKHKANPFHLWLGVGGQFSGEGVWDDCEHVLRPFLLPGTDHSRRAHVQWNADMAAAADRWYFLEYLRQWFGIGATSHPLDTDGQQCFRQATATIPYSFTPDAEIFPGFGSHNNALQLTPVFNGLRHTGAKYYALFQAHTTPALAHNEHGFLGEGFHSIKRLGPYTAVLTLDTRTERQLAGIVDRHSYDMLFSELEARVPATATNLLVVTSNPVVFPRTKNFESILRGASSSGLTQIISYAVGGARKTRNDWVAQDRFGEPVAVTMLNDFWTSAVHKSERAFLVHSLQEFARRRSCRVTFASGHVNCLAASHLRTYTDSRYDPRKFPEQRGFVSDFRSMIQLTVSGVVQEPADSLTLRAYHFAGKSAPFDSFTEEKLYHTFTFDVNHLPPPNNNQKLLGRRSYGIIIEHDFDNDRQRPGLLSFFYVENETCSGTATPYIINIPPLRYAQLAAAAPGGGALPPPPVLAGRPQQQQMRPSVTYRSYTAGGVSSAVDPPSPSYGSGSGSGSGARTKGDPYDGNPDPYSYDVPGYEPSAQQQPPPSSTQSQNQNQQPVGGASNPPPYSPVPQPAVSAMNPPPPRSDAAYSSSYEHTAAWVQGSASHSTGGSDTGGPTHYASAQHQQQQQQQQQQPIQPQPIQQQQTPSQPQSLPYYSQPMQQSPLSQPQQQTHSLPPPSSQQQQQQQQQQQFH
ncbi:hypothetical protein IWW48_004373 [Coemansia sp. RSA 1200]|nr:hypothetical protein IWW48_004373 [Coemansia sp. RSA 1200]